MRKCIKRVDRRFGISKLTVYISDEEFVGSISPGATSIRSCHVPVVFARGNECIADKWIQVDSGTNLHHEYFTTRNHEFNTIGFELAKYMARPVCQQPPPAMCARLQNKISLFKPRLSLVRLCTNRPIPLCYFVTICYFITPPKKRDYPESKQDLWNGELWWS